MKIKTRKDIAIVTDLFDVNVFINDGYLGKYQHVEILHNDRDESYSSVAKIKSYQDDFYSGVDFEGFEISDDTIIFYDPNFNFIKEEDETDENLS